MFTISNLTFKIRQKTLVNIPDLTIEAGAFTALIGPNGAGKTTFLNLLSGDLMPSSGHIVLEGKALDDYSIDELAIKRSVLPQTEHIPFSIKSRAILLMGVMPYQVAFNHPKVTELLIEVSATLELDALLDLPYQTLSGGEQHRVQIARVLMQTLFSLEGEAPLTTRTMLLDEPFNHLDLYHQQQLLRYFKSLTQKGLTIICVMHDINHALQIADHLVLLKHGTLQGRYTPAELWQTDQLQQTFEVEFITLHHPHDTDFRTLAFRV